jgi:nucleoside 2-deoxyribosyltransferase
MPGPSKIYFACSIRGGRDDVEVYRVLVEHIKTQATVLTELFADAGLTAGGSPGKSHHIYAQDIGWIQQADAVIAEVTNPSLGVGYEIAKAEEWHKPVLALFRDHGSWKLSAMIDGSPHLQVSRYRDIVAAKRSIDTFIELLVQSDKQNQM